VVVLVASLSPAASCILFYGPLTKERSSSAPGTTFNSKLSKLISPLIKRIFDLLNSSSAVYILRVLLVTITFCKLGTRYGLGKEMSRKKRSSKPGVSPYGLPLPPQKIRLVSEEDIGGRDLLIVGDVHGCCDELQELLATNDINKENTCVVFVGDLVNKGPKSVEVVEFVMRNNWLSVRGNQDEVSLLELKEAQDKKEEPPPKYTWVTGITEESQKWLNNLPYAIHIPSRSIIVVHAGLIPDTPLEEQLPDILLHMRCVKRAESGVWEWTPAYVEDQEHRLWGEVWSGPEHVYFGHDARRFFQQHKYATGLDTACVYGCELTAIYPLGRQVLKLKAHKNYTNKTNYGGK
jgi:predicted phosphodiesterase